MPSGTQRGDIHSISRSGRSGCILVSRQIITCCLVSPVHSETPPSRVHKKSNSSQKPRPDHIALLPTHLVWISPEANMEDSIAGSVLGKGPQGVHTGE